MPGSSERQPGYLLLKDARRVPRDGLPPIVQGSPGGQLLHLREKSVTLRGGRSCTIAFYDRQRAEAETDTLREVLAEVLEAQNPEATPAALEVAATVAEEAFGPAMRHSGVEYFAADAVVEGLGLAITKGE